MDPENVPDDVWMSIFEQVHPRQLASIIQPTCRRFHDLAARPLLRSILWLTESQTVEELELWREYRYARVLLPKSIWLELRLDCRYYGRYRTFDSNMPMYESIHDRLLTFGWLHTLTISNISFSEHTYRVLERNIPTIRKLKILNSEYCSLNELYRDRVGITHLPPIQNITLPITHFHLHNVRVKPQDNYSSCHPLRLLTCPNLTSLAIRWDPTALVGYQLHVHDPFSRNMHIHGAQNMQGFLATHIHPLASPSLRNIEINIPRLQYKGFEGLISLTSPRPSVSPSDPALRVKVNVTRNALTAEEGSRLTTARHRSWPPTTHSLAPDIDPADYGVVRGVWSYTGPYDAVDVFVTLKDKHHEEVPLEDSRTPLTHLRLTPPAQHVSTIAGLLKCLSHPLKLEQLDVCVYYWDVEMLYAIRKLCPNVVGVVVRYGEGEIDRDSLITLGASLLPDLESLRTLRLVYDPKCAVGAVLSNEPLDHDMQPFNGDANPLPHPHQGRRLGQPKAEIVTQRTPIEQTMDREDLEAYVRPWNRYAGKLRQLQIDGTMWVRRWDGDGWHPEQRAAGDEDVEEADFGWSDGSEEVR